jgi:hypothetical protein
MKPTNNLASILENVGKFSSKTKKEAEFVVTRYNENLEWTKGLEHLLTIYNKGDPSFEFKDASLHHVPNFGVGIETILRHIISNYHTLADTTMFCQATLADREDQPMHPLDWYFEEGEKSGVRGVMTDSYDGPRSRMRFRISNDGCKAVKDRTLAEFRQKVVGIPYRYLVEFWVRGDWMSVTKEAIRKKPLEYYTYLYSECRFGRGLLVEECWFMERTFASLFTRLLSPSFTYTSKYGKEVLLT